MLDFARILVLALVSAGATALLAFTPRAGEDVIIVFAPWVEDESIPQKVWRSGGHLTEQRALGVHAASAAPDFFQELRRNGALLVLSAERASALCGYDTRI